MFNVPATLPYEPFDLSDARHQALSGLATTSHGWAQSEPKNLPRRKIGPFERLAVGPGPRESEGVGTLVLNCSTAEKSDGKAAS